eukprot:scaffold554593_cov14-Prasinocladus_malaysianus.AAC.1
MRINDIPTDCRTPRMWSMTGSDLLADCRLPTICVAELSFTPIPQARASFLFHILPLIQLNWIGSNRPQNPS